MKERYWKLKLQRNRRARMDTVPVEPPAPAGEPLVFEIDTTQGTDTTLLLPLSGNVNVTVDWGDETVETYSADGIHSHTYATDGQYSVSVLGHADTWGHEQLTQASPGQFENTQWMLRKINSWGTFSPTTLLGTFAHTYQMDMSGGIPSSATHIPYLMSRALTTTTMANLQSWDVSNVVDARELFAHCGQISNITNWDVSNIQVFRGMFREMAMNAIPIGIWQPTSARDMSEMFYECNFNQDISGWTMPHLENIQLMFYYSWFEGNISAWDVSQVTEMGGMNSGSWIDHSYASWELNPNVNFDVDGVQCGPFGDFQGTGASTISPENYARTIIGWANNIFSRGGVVTNRIFINPGVSMSTDVYGDIQGEFNNAPDAIDYLVDVLGWTVDGRAPQ